MMVSFIDHYNPISVDRFPSKTKIGRKFLINDSLLLRKRVTPEFSSAAKTFFIKNKHFSESHWWEYTKCCFKENSNIFSKNSITQENITILRLKQDYKTYIKKKNSSQKLNQRLKTYKMKFIN